MGNKLNVEDLAKQLHESQAKYTYFLLAAAASGIAFAIQRTTGDSLRWSVIPLGIAVLCWAFSFFAGCFNRQYHNAIIYANANLFKVFNGEHPDVPNRPDYISAAAEGIRSAMEENSNRANKWMRRQFRLLVAGAIMFVLWHILEMFLRMI